MSDNSGYTFWTVYSAVLASIGAIIAFISFVRTLPSKRLSLDFSPDDLDWREKGVIEGNIRAYNPTERTMVVTRIRLKGPEPNSVRIKSDYDVRKTSEGSVHLQWTIQPGDIGSALCEIIFAQDHLPKSFQLLLDCTGPSGAFVQKLKVVPPPPPPQPR